MVVGHPTAQKSCGRVREKCALCAKRATWHFGTKPFRDILDMLCGTPGKVAVSVTCDTHRVLVVLLVGP